MRTKLCFLAAVISMVAIVGGCCEQEKQRISQLAQDNEALADQLRLANEQLDGKEAELVNAHNDLSAAKNQLNRLGVELAEARKAPKLPPGWKAKAGGMVMKSLASKVLFDSGLARLKGGATASLNQIISEINMNFPGRDVYIIGHTDTDPIRKTKWRDNLELSLHRAAEVARYLAKRGLNPKNVVVSGCGEHRPIASNLTQKGRARNRRVEFWILNPVR